VDELGAHVDGVVDLVEVERQFLQRQAGHSYILLVLIFEGINFIIRLRCILLQQLLNVLQAGQRLVLCSTAHSIFACV
jgi:hypothetical protein